MFRKVAGKFRLFFLFFVITTFFHVVSLSLRRRKMRSVPLENFLRLRCWGALFLSERCSFFWRIASSNTNFAMQDRENDARFGATPVPGKIGAAMAGQGFSAQPLRSSLGGGGNPGNQLYVGNVSINKPIRTPLQNLTCSL